MIFWLEQELAINILAKSSSPPVFVNKVLWEHSNSYVLICCLRPCSYLRREWFQRNSLACKAVYRQAPYKTWFVTAWDKTAKECGGCSSEGQESKDGVGRMWLRSYWLLHNLLQQSGSVYFRAITVSKIGEVMIIIFLIHYK